MLRVLSVLLVLVVLAPLARGAPAPRRIAVTIDDLPLGGPDTSLAEVTAINRAIVDRLQRERIPAVGFVNEEKLYRAGEVDERIALLRLWVEAGLELGNHTWSHPDLNKVGVAAYAEEVVRGETVTRMLLAERGRALTWFRHCFLRTGRTSEDKAAFEAFLAGRGYRVAPVTVENDDWQFNAAYVKARRAGDTALADRVADAYVAHWTVALDYYEGLGRELFGRDIAHVLLLHDNALNADHLGRVIELVRARGYVFVSLEEALEDPAYTHADTYVGPWGKSWLQRWWITEGKESRLKEHPWPPEWIGG